MTSSSHAESVHLIADLDFYLPEEKIALKPSPRRTESRLLVAKRGETKAEHFHFGDLPKFLKKGDVLVLNNAKVIPARLWGERRTGARVETVLLEKVGYNEWEALCRPAGRLKKHEKITYRSGKAEIIAVVTDDARKGTGKRRLRFQGELTEDVLSRVGHMPLPPYINRPDNAEDRQRYQTVFAEKPGAVAAPTAGLHFDEKLLEDLRALGVEIVTITLDVSYGTFQPINVDDIREHDMFEEKYEISQEAANQINQAVSEKRRVIACGTTSVRAVESSALETGAVQSGNAKTKLCIYPPYTFKVVSGLITNFHLPKSSLLFLVSAFWGGKGILQLYQEAIDQDYRFYSYGDAMLLL